jgi:hypothetical protein
MANYGAGAAGALSGAATGAALGSFFPGVGNGIGAVGGGLLGGLSGLYGGDKNNFLTGSQGQMQNTPNFTPQQQGVQNQALQQLMQLMGQQGQPNYSGFQPIEDRARQQFNTQTVPGLAERFTSLGGGQRSSAFQGALGQYGSDLNSQLSALRSQYGVQQQQLGQNQLSSLSNIGFQPSFQNQYTTGQPGLLHELLPLLLQVLTKSYSNQQMQA